MTETHRKRLFGAALAAALLAYNGLGPLVFLVPGLLWRGMDRLPDRTRYAWVSGWGLSFAASYYVWALTYGALAWLGLTLVRATPWLLFALARNLADRKAGGTAQAVGCSVGYGTTAFLLLVGPTGADWDTPASALALWPWTLAYLPWLGLTGYALVVGLVSWLLLCSGLKGALRALGALALLGAGGGLLYQQRAPLMPRLSIALVQSGWEQDQKWDRQNKKKGQERLFDLTRQAAGEGAELVVWPETAWPNRGFRRRPTDSRAVGKLARALGVEILATSIEEQGEEWFNSVSQVSSKGRFLAEYRKRRLAPFAEYLPFPQGLQTTLRELTPFQEVSRYLPGEERVVWRSGGVPFGVLVCYESMVGWPVAEYGKEAEFIIVVTNDAPFRWDWPREAHFRSAILRAAQYGVAVFQASNTGVTGFVDARGQVIRRTKPGFSGPAVVTHRSTR